jgi:glycerophosphoryl diester phosphodiesterase
MCTTALFAACGGDGNTSNDVPWADDVVSVNVANVTPSYTSATVKVNTVLAESIAYIVDQQSDKDYSAESLFTEGTTVACSAVSTTFTISSLVDNSTYTVYVAAVDSDGIYSDVVNHTFTTKQQPEFTLVSKEHEGFIAIGRIPDSVPATSVVKWAITDLASYNFNGGEANDNYWLNRNEAIYSNILNKNYELKITPESRTFTKDGTTYAHYEPILPGQPVVLLLAEYGEGSHNEWGAGHYSPLFGSANPSGYLRKEIIVTTKPSAITSKPNVKFDLRPSGKGSISISAPADIAKVNYLILNPEQYNQSLELLNNTESYLQWFTTSTLAKELFGAVEAKGNIQIDASKLNLKPDTDYRLLITASGNSYGTKQSFAVHTFNLPPSAPLPAGNIIIAHRGGSAEAGKAATPDNSIASLNYAMRLGCYASETDIYWTKDNKIVVAHANSECKINGLYPWEHTLTEIQAAGRLTNGEIVPSLEDYIRAVMVKGSKTKICLDIKSITKPTTHHPESVKACQRACEIIAEMEAQNFCEFICSGYEDIVKHCAKYANAIGVDIGAMGRFTASQYKGWGYTWHNRDKGYDISQSKLKSYIDAGMEVSVFTLDTDADWALISGHWKQLRGITTNYPKRMLEKTK